MCQLKVFNYYLSSVSSLGVVPQPLVEPRLTEACLMLALFLNKRTPHKYAIWMHHHRTITAPSSHRHHIHPGAVHVLIRAGARAIVAHAAACRLRSAPRPVRQQSLTAEGASSAADRHHCGSSFAVYDVLMYSYILIVGHCSVAIISDWEPCYVSDKYGSVLC